MQLQKENIENMEQMNTTKEYRSDKYINYTNHSNDTETGLYDSMIDSNDYFAVFRFLLSGMAYELMREKCVSE